MLIILGSVSAGFGQADDEAGGYVKVSAADANVNAVQTPPAR